MSATVLLLAGLAAATPLDPASFASLGTLAPGGPITVDTDVPEITGATAFTGTYAGDVAVFAFDSVSLDVPVTVVGHRPLAILSHTTLALGASGSVALAADGWRPGPGGYRGGFLLPAELPCEPDCQSIQGKGLGGGSGTNLDGAGGGGHGGVGGTSGFCVADPSQPNCSGSLGGAAYSDPATVLQGGSGGARPATYPGYYRGCLCLDGAGGTLCYGGGGGGALELGATGAIDLAGTVDVGGGDAGPGLYNAGGGGGAGGAVLVHGQGGTLTGALLAAGGPGRGDDGGPYSGGGGGGGGRITVSGLDTVSGVLDVAGGLGALGYFGSADAEDGGPGVVVIDGDGDWLDDDDEVALHGTDPARRDTDHGAMPDGLEVWSGRDPTWGGDDGPSSVLTEVSGSGPGLHVFEATELPDGATVRLASAPALDTSYLLPGCTQPTPLGIGPTAVVHDSATATGGVATLELSIPAGSGTRYFVAFQAASCRVSSIVPVTVP